MYSCGNCSHAQKLPVNPQKIGDKPQMECRRFPPQVIALPIQTLQGGVFAPAAAFPVVSETQYCGEYLQTTLQSN